MKVCILGDGLTSFTLATALTKLGINVDIFLSKNIKNQSKNRTLGISKNNIDFFNQNILNTNSLSWGINKIEIYSENLKNDKLLNFENSKKELFFVLKNYNLHTLLIKELKKNSLVSFKRKTKYTDLIKKNYNLIINCDAHNYISKKFFFKKLDKNYNSYAHTTIINHDKLFKNNIAIQIFTKNGPLAFLPISKKETSVIYSSRGSKNFDFKNFINKNNKKNKINKFNKVFSFKLISSNLRFYHHKNILAFGDLLHRLHPLAGQGFNMTIRDIKELIKIIQFRLNLGLDLDSSICSEFERKTRHKNFIFSNGVDFIYEFFNFESKMDNKFLSKSLKLIDKNKSFKNIFKNIADRGLMN